MNIVESTANYLATLGVGTLGQDIFIGSVPSSNLTSANSTWWVVGNGGGPIRRNSSGEMMKSYSVLIYNRQHDYKSVYDDMQLVEEKFNCNMCSQLTGFDTIDMQATAFPVDEDLDLENRKVGMLQVTITTYKECQ